MQCSPDHCVVHGSMVALDHDCSNCPVHLSCTAPSITAWVLLQVKAFIKPPVGAYRKNWASLQTCQMCHWAQSTSAVLSFLVYSSTTNWCKATALMDLMGRCVANL